MTVVIATQQQANINLFTGVHTVVFMALRTRAKETVQVEFREVGADWLLISSDRSQSGKLSETTATERS